MKNLNVLAAAAACLLVPVSNAPAATVQLESQIFNGTDFTYSYGGALAPTEGLISGTKLIILDFAGYVAGSVFSPYASIVGSTELTSSGILIDPSVFDDPTIDNVVFTYTGPDFQAGPSGAPYTSIDFSGLLANSLYGATALSGFSTVTVKNTSSTPSLVYSAGLVLAPTLAVPEPATWAMLLFGFGAIGMATRRRPRQSVSFS